MMQLVTILKRAKNKSIKKNVSSEVNCDVFLESSGIKSEYFLLPQTAT